MGMVNFNPDFVGCSFDVKNDNAAAAGVLGTLFYNNDTSITTILALFPINGFVPSAIISNVDSEFLKDEIRNNNDFTVSFPNHIISVDHPNANKPSFQSMWGPTFELRYETGYFGPRRLYFQYIPIRFGFTGWLRHNLW